ncbi:WXG100 family type VII secretion target [Micromonospora echinofusca]|uniref:WXG100 family type VII secretion target n=1 Tax=Micromonospora echinofusca TaxID=47858 RepID=A0ABS3VWW4_MICEH|nr:hypothetical protein [Micromonospora echinofusca]MBO4209039.1 hypothetical protein [Micromonospora echinofusca]
MADTIIIDADALEKVAAQLKVPAETVRLALRRLNDNLAALGTPWGDDELGQQWSKTYLPGVEKVQASFEKIVQALLNLSDSANTMALRYKQVEEHNTR